MKRTLFILFLFSSISFASMDCIEIDLIFDNSVNRGLVYDWAVEKSSITTWKIQEIRKPYEISYGTPTATGYGVKITFRTDMKNPTLYNAIKNKWTWIKNNMGSAILRAKVQYHICDNDEPAHLRTGCTWKILYIKDLIQ